MKILFCGEMTELKTVCGLLDLDYRVCASRYHRGDPVEKILRPTDKKWKKKDRHMKQKTIKKQLRSTRDFKGLYEGVSDRVLKALLSGNSNELLRA